MLRQKAARAAAATGWAFLVDPGRHSSRRCRGPDVCGIAYRVRRAGSMNAGDGPRSAARRLRAEQHPGHGVTRPTASPQSQRRAAAKAALSRRGTSPSDALGRAELRRRGHLGDERAAPARARGAADRRSRQRDITEFFVLEWQLGALDLHMRAQARQALGEMTPVGRRQRTCRSCGQGARHARPLR